MNKRFELTESDRDSIKKLYLIEQSENTEVLPKLNVRKLSPVIQGSFLVPNFIPRETNANVIEPDSDFFYRLFLKCCFVGPRIGHLH